MATRHCFVVLVAVLHSPPLPPPSLFWDTQHGVVFHLSLFSESPYFGNTSHIPSTVLVLFLIFCISSCILLSLWKISYFTGVETKTQSDPACGCTEINGKCQGPAQVSLTPGSMFLPLHHAASLDCASLLLFYFSLSVIPVLPHGLSPHPKHRWGSVLEITLFRGYWNCSHLTWCHQTFGLV